MYNEEEKSDTMKDIREDLYDANYDQALVDERRNCKDLCFQYNQTLPSDEETHHQILTQLLGSHGEHVEIIQPFWCDYGYHIHLGERVFINHNCVMLDGADITIGNDVFIAPDCGFHTAGHPVDVNLRKEGLEYAYPITIDDNVWIGANVTVLPNVHIGEGSIIGAGSVVNKDIPPHVIAAGNPCRIIRNIEGDGE